MLPVVHEARASQFREIAQMLANAFADDPISRFLFPDEHARQQRLPGFYRSSLPMLARRGPVYVDANLRGAAVWQQPSPPATRAFDDLLASLSMAVQLRSALRRLMALGRAVSEVHIREPHWYLAILGTEPEHQGAGVGSALLAHVIEHCDADALPAYLESSKESNLRFYRRHGFEVSDEIQVSDGPTLWAMVRRPGER